MSTYALSARDGVVRQPSQDASVHRPLVVVDPPMAGRDVEALQRSTRTRLRARGLADDIPVPTHGKFTHATALACLEAQYFLGLLSATYLRRDGHGHRLISEGAQRVIREPATRDPEQLQRAKDRHAQIERGPRYYEELARECKLTGNGVKDALAYAAEQVGTREQPPGSNAGPKIDTWCRAGGYTSPVPWCGCFVNACLMAGGLPSGAGWIGYTPAILERAQSKTAGWSWQQTGAPGDLALFDSPGGDPVEHVEIVREKLSDTVYSTIGGNTNGGMVARNDHRSTLGTFRIVGFARPPWKT